MPPHMRSLLQIHGAVLLFGFAGVLGDRRLLPLSPFVIVFGRVAFASLTLLIAARLRPGVRGAMTGRDGLAFAALGALLAVHWTTFYAAVQMCGVALALLTFSMFPVFVAFLEPLLFRERLRAADVVLAAAATVGVAILAPSLELHDKATQGVLWGITSGLTFALLSLLNRKYVRRHSSITIALYQDVFAALVLLPLAVLFRPVAVTIGDVLLLAVLGVLCTAVAHSLFIASLHGVRTRTASMIACLEPVYGAALAAFILGDIPTARTVLGGAVVLGVAFYATLHAGRDH